MARSTAHHLATAVAVNLNLELLRERAYKDRMLDLSAEYKQARAAGDLQRAMVVKLQAIRLASAHFGIEASEFQMEFDQYRAERAAQQEAA